MNANIEAILAQYKLTAEQLTAKTKRKIKELDEIEKSNSRIYKNVDGTLTEKATTRISDLNDDIQREIIEVYEEIQEQEEERIRKEQEESDKIKAKELEEAEKNKPKKTWWDEFWGR